MRMRLLLMFGLAIFVCPSFGQVPAASEPVGKPEKVYRVGGDVKAPRVITSFQPRLDEQQGNQVSMAKKSTTVGSSVLRIVVERNGTVRSAKVVRSFKHDLDANAIDAVKQWRFEPATKKGVPVPVELEVQVEFHLYR